MKVTLGFTLIGDGNWIGGLNYQRAVLELLSGPLDNRFEACLMVAPDQEQIARDNFDRFLKRRLVVDNRVKGAGSGARALKALIGGSDRAFADLANEQGIDVMFENAHYYGSAFPIPILSWMPDFQHRYLPNLFSRAAWWKREIGYRAQTVGNRVILLSSEAARDDCERFYPGARGKTAVARFSSCYDIEATLKCAKMVIEKYELPRRFFFMPNHFWAHKNHTIVVKALKHIREVRGKLEGVAPVVMCGPTSDPRDQDYYKRTMDAATGDGLSYWFRHLGRIEYADVLALNAAASAVINPSFFEGWATSVEEAKSFGTPLFLSELNVHREQYPQAEFFAPHDFKRLADLMMDYSTKPLRKIDNLEYLISKNSRRVDEFALSFGAAVDACMAKGVSGCA